MKRTQLLNSVLIPVALMGLSACREIDFMDPFVEQSVEIEAVDSDKNTSGALEMAGELVFTHTQYTRRERTECDRVICGYDEVYRCHRRERCFRGEDGKRRCEPYRDCGYESEPRFCDTNCRNVPYWDSETFRSTSNILVRVKGVPQESWDDIEEIMLGARTNSKFQEAMEKPSTQPEKIQAVLKQLEKTDKTVLLLKAKGFRLRASQDFLKLPENFDSGDPVTIELDVEPTGSGKTEISAIGSEVNFPDLHTSSSDGF